jgi:hypothetical protein
MRSGSDEKASVQGGGGGGPAGTRGSTSLSGGSAGKAGWTVKGGDVGSVGGGGGWLAGDSACRTGGAGVVMVDVRGEGSSVGRIAGAGSESIGVAWRA